jgi:hypothetical protein
MTDTFENLISEAWNYEREAFEENKPIDYLDLAQWFAAFRVRCQEVLQDAESDRVKDDVQFLTVREERIYGVERPSLAEAVKRMTLPDDEDGA